MVASAQCLIGELPDDLLADEQALLSSQVQSLGTNAPIVDLRPPDPAAPQIVRNSKALKGMAEQLADADEIVIDLETSALDPRAYASLFWGI